MAVNRYAVVCAPICHNAVNILKCTFTGEGGNKPGCGPSGIGSLIDCVVNFIRKINRLALCKLKHRADTVYNVNTKHCYGHFCAATEMA